MSQTEAPDKDGFVSDAARRDLIKDALGGVPIWKFERDLERNTEGRQQTEHERAQADVKARLEKNAQYRGGTFKEQMAPGRAKNPLDVARAAIQETIDPAVAEYRAKTFQDRVGTDVANIEEQDNGLAKVAEMPSRLDDTLEAIRSEKAEKAEKDAAKAARQAELQAGSADAWKTGLKPAPKIPENQIEWSGGGPVSDIVKAGRRSKEDILNDPMPWSVSIKQDKKDSH